MTLRVVKLTMVLAVALYYTLLVFNNITDFNSNYQFVRHVLMMDSTFPGNHGMWRALNQPAWHLAFYISIIGWEFVTMILCWWGGWRAGASAAWNCCRVRPRETHFNCWADAGFADVAGGFSDRRRRMVPDVAVENVERSGSGGSHVRW